MSQLESAGVVLYYQENDTFKVIFGVQNPEKRKDRKNETVLDWIGGKVDGLESFEQTASRELYEESRKFFSITPEEMAKFRNFSFVNPVSNKGIALYFKEIDLAVAKEYINYYPDLVAGENGTEHLAMTSVSAIDLLKALDQVTSEGLCKKKQYVTIGNVELRFFSAILMIRDEFKQNLREIIKK